MSSMWGPQSERDVTGGAEAVFLDLDERQGT